MIILVQINYSEDHSEKILPMGILSVGSALKRHNFEVELLNITEKEIQKIANYILNTNPYLLKSLRATYSHVFLDEFQDTTTNQYQDTTNIVPPPIYSNLYSIPL